MNDDDQFLCFFLISRAIQFFYIITIIAFGHNSYHQFFLIIMIIVRLREKKKPWGYHHLWLLFYLLLLLSLDLNKSNDNNFLYWIQRDIRPNYLGQSFFLLLSLLLFCIFTVTKNKTKTIEKKLTWKNSIEWFKNFN